MRVFFLQYGAAASGPGGYGRTGLGGELYAPWIVLAAAVLQARYAHACTPHTHT